jgi:hypothetical protein
VPHIINELLGREMVTAPPLDTPSPQPLAGGGGARCQRCDQCTPGPPSVRASVAVAREPTEVRVLLSTSPKLVTRSS